MSGRVFLPRLGISNNVSFVFDTGADFTLLMPADAATMGIDYDQLKNPGSSFGIGGPAMVYLEPAHVAFISADGDRLYGFDIQLYVQHPSTPAMHVPSLLGRDIIDRLRTTYDKSKNELLADVLSSEVNLALGPIP